MKCIVQYGYEPYIDEVIEAPTHAAAVEIPEDLVRRFNDTSRELQVLEQQIKSVVRTAVKERSVA